jgi:phenylacetic acid degradation operon negative regulatory protein
MPADAEALIHRLLERMQPKAKSLVVTIWGDAIAHRGGSAWLGSVIALAALVGLNERTVRTSVFRLAQEGWLASQQVGRRSFYRLTDDGRRRIDAVHERLYGHAPRAWNQAWTIVALNASIADPALRETLRRELSWLGFGVLPGGMLLHPDPDERALRRLLGDAAAHGQALVLQGQALPIVTPDALRATAYTAWDLDRMAGDYAGFLGAFRPVWQALRHRNAIAAPIAFAVRTLLMHGYRRACLRDPFLPDELLPADWPGAAARLLCRNLYRHVHAAAERHVAGTLETSEGPAPQAHPSYYERFGGLGAAAP